MYLFIYVCICAYDVPMLIIIHGDDDTIDDTGTQNDFSLVVLTTCKFGALNANVMMPAAGKIWLDHRYSYLLSISENYVDCSYHLLQV
jgi:hypothetical protein